MSIWRNSKKKYECNEEAESLKTSLKWLTVVMPLLETSKRLERDKTRVRLERDYGGWPNINYKIAGKNKREQERA